jgi:hypothetical protein
VAIDRGVREKTPPTKGGGDKKNFLHKQREKISKGTITGKRTCQTQKKELKKTKLFRCNGCSEKRFVYEYGLSMLREQAGEGGGRTAKRKGKWGGGEIAGKKFILD